ncbi:MAG: molybdopterin-synthase adenylyltransferase MoeB, partial [Thermoanaerobaculia bacterium]|nr:molybdopterin-synthase adenylyltransferase MoeB [Thermoanaerobaculia bacterium]
VLLIGAGGLGCPLAQYLAAAGVGHLGLVDDDVVDLSNLQRQVLYGQSDVGRPKLEAAVERLRDVNPHVRLEPHPVQLTSANAMEVVSRYDVVVDGSDNFPTRYLVNDACVLARRPNVYGSIFRFEGQVSVFWGERGPCYRCLFAEPPPPGSVPSCAEGGVLGVLPGIIGSLQANETLKLLLRAGDPLVGRLLLFDALKLDFRELALGKSPDCPVCGESPTLTELIDYDRFCGVAPPAPAAADDELETTPLEVRERLGGGEAVTLLDVRTPQEWSICRLEGAAHIPLQELPERFAELDPSRPLVVYCHSGVRSRHAAVFLRRQGYPGALSLAGGIDRWSREVDPSVPRY